MTARASQIGHGLQSSDEMCQIHIGYVSQIEGLKIAMVYSRAVVGGGKILHHSYCGPSDIKDWHEIKESELIFNNSMQFSSSNQGLTLDDNADDITRIIHNELLWSFQMPVLTLNELLCTRSS